MDIKTGDIFPEEQCKKMRELFSNIIKPMILPPLPKQLSRKPVHPEAIGRVGRNDDCPCGSGKKFKKCCMVKT